MLSALEIDVAPVYPGLGLEWASQIYLDNRGWWRGGISFMDNVGILAIHDCGNICVCNILVDDQGGKKNYIHIYASKCTEGLVSARLYFSFIIGPLQ